MLHENQYGRDGRKPERSAISGRALAPEDVYTSINGYTLGAKAVEWRSLSLAEKRALKAEWANTLPTSASNSQAEPQRPDYDSMSLDELKAYAVEHEVDITGRRSKADIAQALRVADVSARFASPEAVSEGIPLDVDSIQGQ